MFFIKSFLKRYIILALFYIYLSTCVLYFWLQIYL